MRVWSGSFDSLDKLLCEGEEAVDSASVGYWRTLMLERIGEFSFGADGREVGERPSSLQGEIGSFPQDS